MDPLQRRRCWSAAAKRPRSMTKGSLPGATAAVNVGQWSGEFASVLMGNGSW